MENVYILSDNQALMKGIIEQMHLPKSQIIDYESFEFAENYHDWITNTFKNNDIKKLILPLSILPTGTFNAEGLKFVLHLRLNYELNLEKRCIPIILLSDFNLDILIAQNNFDKDTNPQNLFFTKGIFRSSFDLNEIIQKTQKSQAISEQEYFQGVLNKLKITQKESEGKHSIANAWGCFKLAQAIGINEIIFKDPAISSYLKTLYAKYLICINKSFEQKTFIDLSPLKCNRKKILFIDDQSDEGWSTLMKNIFKGAGDDFMSIDSGKYKNKETKKFHDFKGFYSECQSHIGKDWDLVIVDLRLNPEEEDIDNEIIKPNELSGYKLIDEFLKENEGYQILVSTASNKVWNINAAMERGASAYYIKESPEFNYPISETRKHYENFKNDSVKCFEKSELRDIYKLINQIKEIAQNRSSKFHLESMAMLDIAWQLLKLGKLDFSFLTLFQVVELYAGLNYNRSENSIIIDGHKKIMIEKNEETYIWQLKFNRDNFKGDYFSSSIEEKDREVPAAALYQTSCLLKFVFNQDDDFLKRFGQLNDKRNKVAHKGSKGFVIFEEIKEILRILKMISE